MIYNKIYDFCKVRDVDRKKYSNRAKFLVNLLTELGIEHKVIRTKSIRHNKYFYNIYVFGSSDKYLSCHYDVVDVNADNANDNSASVINAIAYKVMNPSINLLILDGEEPPFMGAGSSLAAKYLKRIGKNVKWIFNLELTGVGSTFFIDNADTQLSKCIQEHFPEAFVTGTPFNDAMIFRNFGYESNVVTCVNAKEEVPNQWDLKTIDGKKAREWEGEIMDKLKEANDDDAYWREFFYSEDFGHTLDINWDQGVSAERTANELLLMLGFIDEVPETPDGVVHEEEPDEPKIVPDMTPLYQSHSPADSVDKMSIDDMKNFVENVVDIIVKNC